ncbi:MAG TPA: hypothetical protein VJX68_09455 [Candidatus Binatus sp.]|uniref:hypothetical protein n=1 Tax=Candidatus Binatus sp. TaxID=2811406 RepID=UPI002B45DC40|nr:hypothetical protein [Candidatus Binatus sp.]HKN13410.1 hypothetical protein [Candidatus Binatus sp.]
MVETMTGGRKVATRKVIGNVPQMHVWRDSDARDLRPSTIAFVKSLTGPKSDSAGTILANRHTKTVTNHFAIVSNLVARIQKRADFRTISETERQGAAPPVSPGTARNDGPGLSDADVLALENVVGVTAYQPADAQKLFAEAYRVISAHPGRRISVEGDDAYGITPAPSAGDYRN